MRLAPTTVRSFRGERAACQAQMVTQRRALVVGAESIPFLQDGHDGVGELVESPRVTWGTRMNPSAARTATAFSIWLATCCGVPTNEARLVTSIINSRMERDFASASARHLAGRLHPVPEGTHAALRRCSARSRSGSMSGSGPSGS